MPAKKTTRRSVKKTAVKKGRNDLTNVFAEAWLTSNWDEEELLKWLHEGVTVSDVQERYQERMDAAGIKGKLGESPICTVSMVKGKRAKLRKIMAAAFDCPFPPKQEGNEEAHEKATAKANELVPAFIGMATEGTRGRKKPEENESLLARMRKAAESL